jgi:hypothetical protein
MAVSLWFLIIGAIASVIYELPWIGYMPHDHALLRAVRWLSMPYTKG